MSQKNTGSSHRHERTLVILKPDAVQRSLIGEILQRLERVGLKMVAARFAVPDRKSIATHYTLDPNWKRTVGEKSIEAYKAQGVPAPSTDPIAVGDKVLANLQEYMTSGPVMLMVWQGAHAVKIVRKLIGGTEPLSSDVGSIRGDYVLDSYQMSDTDGRSIRNLVHASGSVEEAQNEIAHWFAEDDIMEYRLISEQILYDVNLDGILE